MTAAILAADRRATRALHIAASCLRSTSAFRIDGEDISDDELQHHWERVAAAAERAGLQAELGGFEFLFLIAADWFAARGVRTRSGKRASAGGSIRCG